MVLPTWRAPVSSSTGKDWDASWMVFCKVLFVNMGLTNLELYSILVVFWVVGKPILLAINTYISSNSAKSLECSVKLKMVINP